VPLKSNVFTVRNFIILHSDKMAITPDVFLTEFNYILMDINCGSTNNREAQ
jgi:hypothetical protein